MLVIKHLFEWNIKLETLNKKIAYNVHAEKLYIKNALFRIYTFWEIETFVRKKMN